VRRLWTVLALVLVWAALTLPDRLEQVHASTFARLPLELVVVVAVGVLLPRRAGTVVLVLAGVVLGLLTVLKLLDIAFFEALRRPFDLVVDWRYAGSTVALVHDSFGGALGIVILALIGVVAVGLLTLVPLALLELRRGTEMHRRRTLLAVTVLLVVWLLLAVSGTGLVTASTSSYAEGQLTLVPATLHDEHEFGLATRHDPVRDVPGDQLLRGLRGKDVLLVFVESYGRSAVQGSSFSPGVDATLADGDRQLTAAGFHSRSAFLTSPTFGALSWLAHSTLQSGLWVDAQQRYDALVTSHRLTLAQLFKRAGWRTVSDVPADTHYWPQGRFYGYDHFYDSRDVGYRGPRFGYPTMPDQFTLDALGRHELTPQERRPVFAEVDLLSSHAPWSRTPRMVADSAVGDGSVYDGMPATLPSEKDIWPSPTKVRAAYGSSIEYSLQSLVSYVVHHGTDKTVLVVLGDHQPATIVSGRDADHDVPISVIAKDPAVLGQISSWHWQDGLHPSPEAPVWRMDRFRDRFLSAYAGTA
jgi:hypothetical protein